MCDIKQHMIASGRRTAHVIGYARVVGLRVKSQAFAVKYIVLYYCNNNNNNNKHLRCGNRKGVLGRNDQTHHWMDGVMDGVKSWS